MNESFADHTVNVTPPPIKLPPILSKSKQAYVLWMQLVKDIPKTSRYTLGNKIDDHFLAMLTYVYNAAYQPSTEKVGTLAKAIAQLDLVKFLLSIVWESKTITNNQYIKLSADLDEIGRMLGGWKKGLMQKRQ